MRQCPTISLRILSWVWRCLPATFIQALGQNAAQRAYVCRHVCMCVCACTWQSELLASKFCMLISLMGNQSGREGSGKAVLSITARARGVLPLELMPGS